MWKIIAKAFFILVGLCSVEAQINSITEPSFAWWLATDIEEGETKEQKFNNYLADLANITTIGYKDNISIGAEDGTTDKYYYLAQGEIISTYEVSNLAVSGKGFFSLINSDGKVLYTRNGEFVINSNGNLENNDGYILTPSLNLDDKNMDNYYIDNNGTLYHTTPGKTDVVKVYQFQLYLPGESSDIEQDGVYFDFSSVVPVVIDGKNSKVLLGSLELSTIDGATTMANMMEQLYAIRYEIKKDLNKGIETDLSEKDLDFKIYMVDFLLKEYARSASDYYELARFTKMVKGIGLSIIFDEKKQNS